MVASIGSLWWTVIVVAAFVPLMSNLGSPRQIFPLSQLDIDCPTRATNRGCRYPPPFGMVHIISTTPYSHCHNNILPHQLDLETKLLPQPNATTGLYRLPQPNSEIGVESAHEQFPLVVPLTLNSIGCASPESGLDGWHNGWVVNTYRAGSSPHSTNLCHGSSTSHPNNPATYLFSHSASVQAYSQLPPTKRPPPYPCNTISFLMWMH